MFRARLSLLSFPPSVCLQTQEREPSSRKVFNWVPAFAGMIGFAMVGCASEEVVLDRNLVCEHQLVGYETLPISIRLSDELLSERIVKKAEVSYGVSPKSANYIDTQERYTITLPENETFPECIITIDRLSGYAKHLCLGKSAVYPSDTRSQTFELVCKTKSESL